MTILILPRATGARADKGVCERATGIRPAQVRTELATWSIYRPVRPRTGLPYLSKRLAAHVCVLQT